MRSRERREVEDFKRIEKAIKWWSDTGSRVAECQGTTGPCGWEDRGKC